MTVEETRRRYEREAARSESPRDYWYARLKEHRREADRQMNLVEWLMSKLRGN